MGSRVASRGSGSEKDRARREFRREFRFTGTRTSVVNALRRIVLSEIPYVATYRDENRAAASRGGIVVSKNTGRLHDDMLVDRLALVPIHLTRSEVDQFIPGSITVHLAVHNDGTTRRDVSSKDLEVKLFGKPHPNARACYPAHPISGDWPLITRLYPGERVDVTATLEKDKARTHAAFAVASGAAVAFEEDQAAYLAQRSKIEQDDDLDEETRRHALNFCDHITRKRLFKKDGGGEPVGHILAIQSECGLSASEIVVAAMNVLVGKFTSSALTYEAREDGKGSVVFTVSGQGHTFGSVLQDICMRDRDQLGIRSIGYFQTHPLEDRIVVRIDVAGTDSARLEHDALFSKMRAHCARELEQVKGRMAEVLD